MVYHLGMGSQTVKLRLLGCFLVKAAAAACCGCTSVEVIGYQEQSTDTINNTDSSDSTDSSDNGKPPVDSDSGADGLFPIVFDFNESNDGFYNYNNSGWKWSSADGTFDLDVEFTVSPDWRTIEYYVSQGIWPGGVDWTGAETVEYRIRTVTSKGGYFRAFIMSIEEESTTDETWLWYAVDYDLVPDGEWKALTLALPYPSTQLNLSEVTKLGLQIHAPEPSQEEGDTETEVSLPEPDHVVLQVDSIIVRGSVP